MSSENMLLDTNLTTNSSQVDTTLMKTSNRCYNGGTGREHASSTGSLLGLGGSFGLSPVTWDNLNLEDIFEVLGVDFEKSWAMEELGEDLDWSIQKMNDHLQLPTLQEGGGCREFLVWFEDVAQKARRVRPTFSALASCLEISQPHRLRLAARQVAVATNMERAGVVLIRTLFPDDHETAREVEDSLWKPKRCASVELAMDAFVRLLTTHVRLCIAYERKGCLGRHRIIDTYLAMMPEVVEREVRSRCDVYGDVHEVQLVIQRARRLVTPAARKEADSSPSVFIVWSYQEYRKVMKDRCMKCGSESHRKAECPEKNIKCNECHGPHATQICRSLILIDASGRARLKITPALEGIVSQQVIDATRASATRTAAETLRMLVDDRERRNQERREKRNKGKQTMAEANFVMASELPVAYLAEYSRLAAVEARVAGHKAVIVLDGGAEVNVMSSAMAKALGVSINGDGKPMRGIGGVVRTSLTPPIRVEIAGRISEEIFQIMSQEVPLLISKAAMGRLGLIVNYGDETVIGSEEIPFVGMARSNRLKLPIKEPDLVEKVNLESLETVWQALPSTLVPGGAHGVPQVDLRVEGEPRRFPARQLSNEKFLFAKKTLDELLEADLIEKTDSKWISPCHLVQKKPGVWRLTIDYRYVNKHVIANGYPMIGAKEILVRLSEKKIFSKIDLKHGFWNVRITEASREFTGFALPTLGTYVWKVLPQGFKTSAVEFQRIMEVLLHELLSSGEVIVYIDDIIIATKDVRSHVSVLEKVVVIMKDAGLCISREKCEFFARELTVLGQVVGNGVIKPDQERVRAVVEWRPPKDRSELVHLLSVAGYMREYIPKFTEVTEPFRMLKKAKKGFCWGMDHNHAFEALKDAIVHHTILAMPQGGLGYELHTDASLTGVGATLSQMQNGERKFIYFASKSLDETQRRWDTTEREVYALVWALERLDVYVSGEKIKVFTDHKALLALNTTQNPKMMRWAARIAQYDVELNYIPGVENVMADWLSRVSEESRKTIEIIAVPSVHYLSLEPVKMPSIEEIKAAAENETRKVFRWHDGMPVGGKEARLYVPECLRERVMFFAHGRRFSGHVGVNRTYRLLKKWVWWPNMAKEVEIYIGRCPLCLAMRRKPTNPTSGTLASICPNEVVSMDFIGPRSWNNERFYVCCVVDHYSRYLRCWVTRQQNARESTRVLKDWIRIFGVPRKVLCDRGVFYSQLFCDFLTEIGSDPLFVTPYHPQGNGINERVHQILEHAIKTIPDPTEVEFEEAVHSAEVVYNCSVHCVTGLTPASQQLGYDPCLPGWAILAVVSEGEDVRASKRAYWLQRQLSYQLMLEQSVLDDRDLNVGEIAIYELQEPERKRLIHKSGEHKYGPQWSLPHRVLRRRDEKVWLRPIWYHGPIIERAISLCRRIGGVTTPMQELCAGILEWRGTKRSHPKLGDPRSTRRIDRSKGMSNETAEVVAEKGVLSHNLDAFDLVSAPDSQQS